MNAVSHRAYKPFISLMIAIMTLLGIVFLQMEERRLGYTMLKRSREHRDLIEEKRNREIQLAKITRPQLLEHMAQSRFTLKKVSARQIIHLPGEGLKMAKVADASADKIVPGVTRVKN